MLQSLIIMAVFFSCFGQAPSQKVIEDKIDSLSNIIGHYPPSLDDSTQVTNATNDLMKLIGYIEAHEKAFSSYFYNFNLAELYRFAYNLDISGSLLKSESYYLNALNEDPESIDAQIGLSVLFSNSFIPNDTSSFKNVQTATNILKNLRKKGDDVKYHIIDYNLCLSALLLGNQILAFDAGYEYLKKMPADSSAINFKGLITNKEDRCSFMRASNKLKTYQNNCFGFRTVYSDTLILFQEFSDTSNNNACVFTIETPLTKIATGEFIRNSISISGWSLKSIDVNNKLKEVENRLNCKTIRQRSSKASSAIKSYEFTTSDGPPDGFHGIFKAFKTNKYLFVMLYVATGSSYDKNIKYFNEFEKNFKIF